uniref:Uncharacterized protein n=1 Tax=Phocoena sinus TaxID=42100 RepID=A0A8C9CSF2_PHOSS
VLCGYDTVTEALVDQAEAAGLGLPRPDSYAPSASLAFGSWERAQHLRRFSITALRDLGVGKRGIEERIQGEVDFLIEACRAKTHEEIGHVIGKNHQPKFKDGAKMPYTEAVLSAHPSPTPPYKSPLPPPSQGTEVFPMLGCRLRDPKFFSNPRNFNPQHFLDEKGQFNAFVPFSIGKRYCFGEGLARMELFLFLTTIMQNFRFKSPQSPQDIDVSPEHVGFVTIPQNYTMSFLPR